MFDENRWQSTFTTVRFFILQLFSVVNTAANLERYINKVIRKANWDVGWKLRKFLSTGNLVSPTGLDLQQASGFTIVAEKLNWYRYISHFRAVHRGAFFAELKTTTVRKLLPESWGEHVEVDCISVADFRDRFHLPRTYP